MKPCQILQVLIEKASDTDIIGILFSESYCLMFLAGDEWFRAVIDGDGVAFINMKGERHSLSDIRAVKVGHPDESDLWNPPVTHRTSVDHNMGFKQNG